MKLSNLKEAIAEAKRFLERAENLNKKTGTDKKFLHLYGLPKESGSVKRSSMDLTRALSKLRNDNI